MSLMWKLFTRTPESTPDATTTRTENFRADTIRLLKSGTRDIAGDLEENITLVNYVADRGDSKMLMAIHRCLSKDNSVRDVMEAAQELQDSGHARYRELLTENSMTARRLVKAAMESAGARPIDTTMVSAMAAYSPQRDQFIISVINDRGITEHRRMLEIVEHNESGSAA
jgi:hypothetical protein